MRCFRGLSNHRLFSPGGVLLRDPIYHALMKSIVACLPVTVWLLWASAETQAQASFTIYDVREGKAVTAAAIVRAAANFDAVFFGEEHDDPTAHALEHQLVVMLDSAYAFRMAVGMEMFERDVQEVMDEYLGGFILEKHFTDATRPWSNYSDYRPVVEYARAAGLPVVCSNAPRRYTNLAVRMGMDALQELPRASKRYLAPLPCDTAAGLYYRKLEQVMTHGFTPPPDSAQPAMTMPPGIVYGQSLWDATMAWSVAAYLKAHKGHKVFHLNGRFHSDEHFGIVIQLKKYMKKARVLVISCYPSEDWQAPDWEAHKANGDFVILTDPAFRQAQEEE